MRLECQVAGEVSEVIRECEVSPVVSQSQLTMADLRRQRRLHFGADNTNMRTHRQVQASSTPIKFDQSESPPSSAGSYEKLLEITENSGDFRGLILNLEDLSEDVHELKQNFLEQNIQLEKYLARIDSKLSHKNKSAGEDEGEETSDSFVYKQRKTKQTEDCTETSSDSDEDYPDVVNISMSLNSILGSVGQQDVSLMQEVDTIEDKLEKFQSYLQEQKTEITRLELMKEALLMQNERWEGRSCLLFYFSSTFDCRMLKNQKRLEEEQSVTVKIIESKEQEIETLRSQLGLGAGQGNVYAGLGLSLSMGRQIVRHNVTSLLNYLVRQPQQQTSWTATIISLPTRILTSVLSNIL